MKKKTKKLTLSRETVRRLSIQAGAVVGGIHTDPCMTGDCPTAETPCDITVTTCPTDPCTDGC
jgi:hypothetical protein